MSVADAMLKQGEEHLPDFDLTIRWQVYSHHLEFEAKRGTKQDDGSIGYTHMRTGSTVFVDTFEDGERLVGGSIKWDGCSHVNFGATEDDGYLHLCGASCYRRLVKALLRATELATEHLATLDTDCARFPIASENLFTGAPR